VRVIITKKDAQMVLLFPITDMNIPEIPNPSAADKFSKQRVV